MRLRSDSVLWLLLSAIVAGGAAVAACSSSDGSTEPLHSSRAYKGHANDADINAFVNTYRETYGTRLDDCQTCHRGGAFTTTDGKTLQKTACDYCHLVLHPASDFVEPQPTSYAETLNPYGAAYSGAGRNEEALKAIEAEDSDGDGFSNLDEIHALRYPGDERSKPGQPTAPLRVFTMEEVKSLPGHNQFLLANSNKQQYDYYATYVGPTVRDLLTAAGVDLGDAGLEGITVIAPDGYLKDFAMAEITTAYPAGLFYGGLDTGSLGAECGFVQYPDEIPGGVTDGAPIPGEVWMQLAYERDGLPLDVCNLDPMSGKLNGEGPYRLVVPQLLPGQPDRGSQYSPTSCNDGHDYDAAKDHNAGAMVRGVVALRVNPLPSGYEDFDYYYGGFAYIEEQTVIVYGRGIE